MKPLQAVSSIIKLHPVREEQVSGFFWPAAYRRDETSRAEESEEEEA